MANRKYGKDEKTDYIVHLILVQVVVCGLVFAAIAISVKLTSGALENYREAYKSIMKTDLSFSDIANSLWSIGEEPSAEDTSKEDETKTEVLAYQSRQTIVWPITGKITSVFGEREHPTTGVEEYHKGLDIAAPEGTRIGAAMDGTVTYAGSNALRGNYVVISHGNGLVTYYCHCLELLVEEGTVVRAGETVALVGSTGDSTGNHLHFEVRQDDTPTDPEEFLANAAVLYKV